ncbi:protein FATTY ACID EXPORT 1, chloroplastic-like isoform X2 [Durio zibethinus]|uniref:Protein FATTY ACID EXPORT 1, chloroplastic-like isoform X2 n=1 Tax=Durio zibethinus TaxID=66656 RepID=A0A6P5YV62_DURZI|nr:protein FATTY ACID EXPORT 1, chloroplastic-like isoform X2 [Durio zibethinus]
MATAAATTTTTTTISQLSCFSSINRKLQLYHRSSFRPFSRPKSFVVMSVDGRGAEATGSKLKTTPSYVAGESKPFIEEVPKSYPNAEGHFPENTSEPVEENGIIQPKRAAKIHDFCFGIPYGGLVLSGGLVGFVFSRNPTTLLFGGALLALSTFSLRIWRQGKSSLPFILGQAALAAVLFWKNFQTYSLSKKLFPNAFYAVLRFQVNEHCLFIYANCWLATS